MCRSFPHLDRSVASVVGRHANVAAVVDLNPVLDAGETTAADA